MATALPENTTSFLSLYASRRSETICIGWSLSSFFFVAFSGNAVATQGDRVIKSDRLLLYYKKDQKEPEKRVSKDAGNTGDLEKIEAKGHVIVTQGERIVTGDDAVYYQDTQQIIMTGNPIMREKGNIIQGDRIVVYLNEDRGVVESTAKNRVKATIYPADRKEKKKDGPK